MGFVVQTVFVGTLVLGLRNRSRLVVYSSAIVVLWVGLLLTRLALFRSTLGFSPAVERMYRAYSMPLDDCQYGLQIRVHHITNRVQHDYEGWSVPMVEQDV